jgi:predicted acylesterase/phospholipase RssA
MSHCTLAIDGGGILGLIPAMVLAEIEARSGRSAGELFDLVAGTSTGGIIACAVAVGIPAQKVANLYRQRGREIFSRSWGHRATTGPVYGGWHHGDRLPADRPAVYRGGTVDGILRVGRPKNSSGQGSTKMR